jgi:colanic acid biosynthesis glycosyl transferase WcaI
MFWIEANMKITFICSVFPPEPAPSGVMAHQLAARLVGDGHDVRMVAPFPNRPQGIIYPGFRRRLRSRGGASEGYTLVRCANWFIGKRRLSINRILENITFGLSSAWAAWKEGRPDVIVIETWPLIAVQLVALLARWWRVPYIYYVKDVYPEAAEQAGIVPPSGMVARVCRAWDKHLCSRSARVVVISEAMKTLVSVSRQLPGQQFTVIPDWIDESRFSAREGSGTWRLSQGLGREAFVAIFAGTMGTVSGVEALVDVARILREETDIVILCVGEGGRKQAMMEEASRLGLNNIRFLSFQPAERVPEMLASADVALLTMHPEASNSSVPSKLISYLAASRPVICAASAESSVARVVARAGAGLVVSPEGAPAIADAILRLKREPETAHQMGANARLYFEKHYTLRRAYSQFSELLQDTKKGEAR